MLGRQQRRPSSTASPRPDYHQVLDIRVQIQMLLLLLLLLPARRRTLLASVLNRSSNPDPAASSWYPGNREGEGEGGGMEICCKPMLRPELNGLLGCGLPWSKL
jgi:hypothetical protein